MKVAYSESIQVKMLMCRRLASSATLQARNVSLSAVNRVDVPSSKPLSEERQIELNKSRKKLLWRAEPADKPGEWYTKFKLFMQDDDNKPKEVLITKLQKDISWSPTNIKKMLNRNMEKKERYMQQFIKERHEILGNDLAAAHFLIYRQGKVKFLGQGEWIKLNKDDDQVNLPDKYQHGMFLEAADCEGVKLYYEGLENLRRLYELRFLSFKNIKSFDDWCLDRVSGSEFGKLSLLAFELIIFSASL